jgi:hypothetical protein
MNLELQIDQLLQQYKAPRQYAVVCDVCGRIGAASSDHGTVVEAAAMHSANTGHNVRAAKVRPGGKKRGAQPKKKARAGGKAKRRRAGGKGRHSPYERIGHHDTPLSPFAQHQRLNHHMSQHSPNGYDIIKECDECPMRFMLHPGDKYWITMNPSKAQLEDAEKRARR